MKYRELRELVDSIIFDASLDDATSEFGRDVAAFNQFMAGRYTWFALTNPDFLDGEVPDDVMERFKPIQEMYADSLND